MTTMRYLFLMMSYGHSDDVKQIFSGGYMLKVYQSFLMSATLTKDVEILKGMVLRNPVRPSSVLLSTVLGKTDLAAIYRHPFCPSGHSPTRGGPRRVDVSSHTILRQVLRDRQVPARVRAPQAATDQGEVHSVCERRRPVVQAQAVPRAVWSQGLRPQRRAAPQLEVSTRSARMFTCTASSRC